MTSKNLKSKAAQATSKLFSNEIPQNNKQPTKRDNKELSTNTNKQKQVFSFRGDSELVKVWRLYAKIQNIKVDDLGTKALEEYLANHPLEGAGKSLLEEFKNS